MTRSSEFWDELAPHHAAIEDNYLDLKSLRGILQEIHSPVLIVGAGQGLLVAELRSRGFQCDGVDLSPEMIRYARLRRGITLFQADAKAMPFAEATYETVIYATGVVDFTPHEEEIRRMLTEGRRILKQSGEIFIAFYRISAACESFMATAGLLRNHEIAFRKSLELYLLSPAQTISWVAKNAGLGYLRAATVFVRMATLTTIQEKRMTLKMQRIFRQMPAPRSLLDAAQEKQPYRNELEIGNLFNSSWNSRQAAQNLQQLPHGSNLKQLIFACFARGIIRDGAGTISWVNPASSFNFSRRCCRHWGPDGSVSCFSDALAL
jgi:ubiquinone/menaquinone biosynthesis C-methylase UbiE